METTSLPAKTGYGAFYNFNNAIVPNVLLDLDVTSHNTIDKPATVGETVEADIKGTKLPPSEFETKLVWTNEEGQVLKETIVTALADGTDDTWQVPSTAEEAAALNLEDGEVVQVELISAGNTISSDSFILKITDGDGDGVNIDEDPDNNNDGIADDPTAIVTAESQKVTHGVKIDGNIQMSNGDNTDGGSELPADLRNVLVTLTNQESGQAFTSGDASTWRGTIGIHLFKTLT